MAVFSKAAKKTSRALIASSLLSEPLTALLCLLPFVLVKDLKASAWQISLLVSLRPIMSLVSFYWSSLLGKRPEWLKINLLTSGILARLPFLFVYFFDGSSYLIFAAAMHILFSRAGIPPWMEVLKRNLDKAPRERMFSFSSMLGYAEGVGLGFAIGFLLDVDSVYWKPLFLASSVIGLLSVLWQYRIPLELKAKEEPLPLGIVQTIVQPWQSAFRLMRTRPDFARFQWAFMWGGAGVMLMIAVLPIFFADVLEISHKEFSVARTVCTGVGFVLTSSLWGKALGRTSCNLLTSLVILFFALFGAALLLAPYHIFWIYIAYVVYGIAQGGSHNVWYLSGPLFAGKEDSSIYSGINVVMVGVRGMIFPFLGSLLLQVFGPIPVIALGFLLCITGSILTRFATKNQVLDKSLDVGAEVGKG
jgi:MFS family permease